MGTKEMETTAGKGKPLMTRRILKRKGFISNRYKSILYPIGDTIIYCLCKRIVDSITPEALVLTLYHGSGCICICCDEFKGFYEKCIIGTQNVSAFTSAHTGETISYTTVKRGKSLEVS